MTHAVRGSVVQIPCERCGTIFVARTADRERGWGRFCSKTCKANPAATQKEAPMPDPTADPLDPMAGLEPGAEMIARTLGSMELGTQMSTAISLKRLADAFDAIGFNNPNAGNIIHGYITNLAHDAGVDFQRGVERTRRS